MSFIKFFFLLEYVEDISQIGRWKISITTHPIHPSLYGSALSPNNRCGFLAAKSSTV